MVVAQLQGCACGMDRPPSLEGLQCSHLQHQRLALRSMHIHSDLECAGALLAAWRSCCRLDSNGNDRNSLATAFVCQPTGQADSR
jgi:hypothetical protein